MEGSISMVLGTVRDIFVRIVECLRLGLLKGFLLGHGFSEMYYIVTSGFARSLFFSAPLTCVQNLTIIG